MHDDVPPPTPPDAAPDDPSTLPQAVRALLADLPGVLTDRVRLLALELRRATIALGHVVALALLAAILFATAWTAMWVGIAAALVKVAGLAWYWVALLVMFLNLGAAVLALLRIKALAPLLALPATLRRLTGSDSREREDLDAHDRAREQLHAQAGDAARPHAPDGGTP